MKALVELGQRRVLRPVIRFFAVHQFFNLFGEQLTYRGRPAGSKSFAFRISSPSILMVTFCLGAFFAIINAFAYKLFRKRQRDFAERAKRLSALLDVIQHRLPEHLIQPGLPGQ
jgi:hypothetical protein